MYFHEVGISFWYWILLKMVLRQTIRRFEFIRLVWIKMFEIESFNQRKVSLFKFCSLSCSGENLWGIQMKTLRVRKSHKTYNEGSDTIFIKTPKRTRNLSGMIWRMLRKNHFKFFYHKTNIVKKEEIGSLWQVQRTIWFG